MVWRVQSVQYTWLVAATKSCPCSCSCSMSYCFCILPLHIGVKVFKWILSKSAVDPFARLRDADEEFDCLSSFSVVRNFLAGVQFLSSIRFHLLVVGRRRRRMVLAWRGEKGTEKESEIERNVRHTMVEDCSLFFWPNVSVQFSMEIETQ